jgi:hypothetical protein
MSEFHVYMVYWMEDSLVNSKGFGQGFLTETLVFTEQLRKRQLQDKNIHHITFCSEDPNCASLTGIGVTGPEYDWKKRR